MKPSLVATTDGLVGLEGLSPLQAILYYTINLLNQPSRPSSKGVGGKAPTIGKSVDDGKGLPRRHQGIDDGNMSLEGSCLVV